MPFFPENAVVWAEIPVTDLTRASDFYASVLACDMRLVTDEGDPRVDILASGVSAHLYQAAPAPRGTGPTVHFAIDGKLEPALQRALDAGAVAITPIITIPPGRFAKIEDLDGNSIGLFEPT